MVYIFIQVKFRAFLFTFGTVRHVFRVSIPVSVPTPGFYQSIFDRHGVKVEIANENRWTALKLDKVDDMVVKP